MNKLDDVLKNNLYGLYYNNRLILPFQGIFLKVIIDDEIIMDFSPDSKSIYIKEIGEFTDLYFKRYKHLKDAVTKYETIKMVVVDKGENIFNFENHRKIVLYLKEKHKVTIAKTDDDILFIE